MARPNLLAFTLIELLVVITIIVVLLSLLAPALDKAIREAEMTVCGARQRAIATGVLTYTASNKRRYPYRSGVESGTAWPTALLYNGDLRISAAWNYSAPNQVAESDLYDDRPMLRTFVNLNAALNDPLVKPVDFETVDVDSHLYNSYNLFFGFGYKGHAKMLKMGSRLVYTEGAYRWTGRLLVSDRDATIVTGGTQSTHPDHDGRTTNLHSQNDVFQNNHAANVPLKVTISTWFLDDQRPGGRGPVDLNFAYDDASVTRIDDIAFKDQDMDYIPDTTTHLNVATGWTQTVPLSQ